MFDLFSFSSSSSPSSLLWLLFLRVFLAKHRGVDGVVLGSLVVTGRGRASEELFRCGVRVEQRWFWKKEEKAVKDGGWRLVMTVAV